MKKVLFPTEFSDHASEVFQYAVAIAYRFDAKLVVMTAYEYTATEFISAQTKEERVGELTDKMIKFVTTNIPDNIGEEISIDYIVRHGKASEAILFVEREEEIDFIVMGMTGRINALTTSFGSTALAVMAKSDCRVLVVPATAKYKGMLNIVYTTNFEFRDLSAINYLKKWSKTFGADVHCLHIVEEKENGLKAIKNMNVLRKTYKNFKTLIFDMVYGKFKEEVEVYSHDVDADMIVMMTHKRSLASRIVAPSNVNGIATRIDVPVMVIKDNPYEIDSQIEGWLEVVNSIA